jgi:aspartate racemase
MTAIYGSQGIKAGFTRNLPRRHILREAKRLVDQGAELILLGCTETSLVMQQKDMPVPLIDPLQILAEVVIREANISK